MTPQPIRPDAPPTTALYDVFSRKEWAALRANTPLTLTWSDIEALRGVGQPTGPSEVEAIHLPLSRLLNLHITAAQVLSSVQGAFMGRPADRPPYVIGLAGSVAVGKSTFARLLQAILSRWPTHPRVEVVATDAFLHPNRELLERGLMKRKGFPESYDQRRMTQ
ncbi:MAG: type I pantothenate kinase, partial [Phenylobacterium sp.]|nr:type I pantothenate kinase [Phenylobacterium sp.]